MDWAGIGSRIRKQREKFGYTREQFSEMLGVTPKFCADIELGNKGMSVQTLCKISELLGLSSDYILFGRKDRSGSFPAALLRGCTPEQCKYAEEILKNYVLALNTSNRSEKE